MRPSLYCFTIPQSLDGGMIRRHRGWRQQDSIRPTPNHFVDANKMVVRFRLELPLGECKVNNSGIDAHGQG